MIPSFKHFVVAALMALTPVYIIGQAPKLKFKHITPEQGLSNSTIESIGQDHRGFMWFGTRDGLNRFDGNQVVVYKYDAADSTSLSDNFITYIYEDRNRNLWIGTNNGLNRFDAEQNNFTRYRHMPDRPGSLSSNHISCIYQDARQRLWVSTLGGGINLYSPADKKFSVIRYEAGRTNGLASNYVNYLFEDSRNNFWVATDAGLQLFNADDKRFRSVDVQPSVGKSLSIRLIREEKPGSLLLGTNDNGLILFNTQLNTARYYAHHEREPSSLRSNLVRSMMVGRDGSIWIGSVNGGLSLFDPVSGKFFNYQNEPDNPHSLSQRTVSALFEDNQGNLWAGTHRGGINLYMPGTEKFTLYRQESDLNSLSYNDVKAFCEDKNGNIWIGTDGGGLNLFDRNKNSFRHYRYDPFNAFTIGSNEVLDIMEDSEENLWVGTWSGGLCLMNRKTGSFTRFMHNPADGNSISSNFVQKIFEDSKQNLWIATYFGGLNKYDRKTKKFTRITSGLNQKSQLQGNNIVSINEDRGGNIWIGTDDGGLNCLHENTGEFVSYFNNEEKKPDLRVIYVDSKGRVWVGQNGLYLFNARDNVFSLYTDTAGLSTEFIKGIAEDEQGNFWIATSNGITQFNPETRYAKKYNTADGLQGLEFEANAFLKTRDGQLFFGGVNGFNTFYPRQITSNEFIPPVYVTDFMVHNKKIIPGEKLSPLKKDISLTNEITLSHKQATFSFGFAALNFTASENNQYAYILEGWDKSWNYAGTAKKATYNNVGPGTYTFRVKGSNNDGVWNEAGPALVITITPPFYSTWWFRTLVGLSLLTAIIFFYRFKRKLEIQQLEEKKKEELHQVQLQFFTNISHEFRTPLSLILGPLEKLQKENPDARGNHFYRIIYRNAHRLLNLVNELMDFRKSESGVLKLNVMPGSIDSFLQEISEEFSELAHEKNITFNIHARGVSGETWFDRQLVEKIAINLVSNSFKYTASGGTITVEAFESMNNFKPSFENELLIRGSYKGRKYLYLRVADNGIGISKESIAHLFERYYRISESHLGSGIGLAFVKSLTALHKGHIYVYSQRNKGTEIIIGIPVDKNDYAANERWVYSKEGIVKLESIHSNYDHLAAVPEDYRLPPPGSKSPASMPAILLVDDNDDLRSFLKESLGEGYRISEASDGRSGFAKAKEEFPDLIISDIMMPGMNGIEFCKLIKDDIETSHIPFLMLTAKDALESKIEGVGSGADFYFSKPLSLELLELTLRNIFNQKQKLKERYRRDHHAEIKDLVHSTRDKEFLDRLIQLVESHLSDPEMNIDYICQQIGMSRTKLYNKIKSLTGQSIGEFIRTLRLKKAAQMMTHQDVSITEVMYSVGIQTQSYFTKAFKAEFGKTPTQFIKDLKK